MGVPDLAAEGLGDDRLFGLQLFRSCLAQDQHNVPGVFGTYATDYGEDCRSPEGYVGYLEKLATPRRFSGVRQTNGCLTQLAERQFDVREPNKVWVTDIPTSEHMKAGYI